MGKFARVAAHVKNVTADPITTSTKFVGRKVKSGVSHAANAVRTAEQEIENEKALKALQSEEPTVIVLDDLDPAQAAKIAKIVGLTPKVTTAVEV